ncbi:MAG: hypothetical protein U0X75_06890 [Acidobacteriota bacterium]
MLRGWALVEKDKDAVRRGQRAVFGHVGGLAAARRAARAKRSAMAVTRAAHADQRQHAATAVAPPLAPSSSSWPMLPIVRA